MSGVSKELLVNTDFPLDLVKMQKNYQERFDNVLTPGWERLKKAIEKHIEDLKAKRQ